VSDIKISITKTLAHEGGYVNNPADKGGPTKYGITQADMPGQDMQNLALDTAIAYYQAHYVKPLYTSILSQDVLDKLFDMGVLFGVGTATLILQRCLGVPNPDAQLGPITLAHINGESSDDVMHAYRAALAQHVIDVYKANPQDGVFLKGWLNRIAS
jgi:lysozyme family protein